MDTLLPLLEHRQQRIELETSLYSFVQAAWPHIETSTYIDNWHIGAICEHLQAVTDNQISKLLINIPPGCSKSLLVAVFWPMWEWARNPTIRWFFASYDQRLSTRDSVRCRALIQSFWYQHLWGHKYVLTHDQNQKLYYETDKGGYRLATTVRGHGTGEHPDRVVFDDPHNVEAAESELERQSTLDWWDLTMTTRGVSRQARRVGVMQRLHHDDLAGHVLQRGDWVHLCLPMRYEPQRMATTPLGWNDPRTMEGELLTPNQFAEPVVAEMERSLGAYGTAGQLQQNPTPKSGGMFKWEWFNQRRKAAPYHSRRIRYWDRAASENTGCFTAGVLLAADDQGYYVEHVVRGQWEPDQRNEIMKAVALRDRQRYGPTDEPQIWVEAEGGSSGRDAWKGVARALAGFPIREDKVTGKKEVRAEPWACQLAAKNVYLIDNGELEGTGRSDWDIQAYIEEHCQFPLGKYLDQVDSSSGAFNLLAGTKLATPLRILSLQRDRKTSLRLIVCTEDELTSLVLDNPCLLISLMDPKEVMVHEQRLDAVDVTTNGKEVMYSNGVPVNQEGDRAGNGVYEGSRSRPVHGLGKLVDHLTLSFLDLDPAELQDTWNEEIPLRLFRPELGKQLWRFLLKKRSPPPELIVVQDQGDRRALSCAYALCDVLGLKRKEVIYRPADPEWQASSENKPANRYVYAQVKATRALMMD